MKKGNLTIFLAPEFIFWRCLMAAALVRDSPYFANANVWEK
jgi:hypothetical protein